MALISLALSKLTNSIPWTSQNCLAPNQSVCKTVLSKLFILSYFYSQLRTMFSLTKYFPYLTFKSASRSKKNQNSHLKQIFKITLTYCSPRSRKYLSVKRNSVIVTKIVINVSFYTALMVELKYLLWLRPLRLLCSILESRC